MKPSNVGKLSETYRKEARRHVLYWWPDRNRRVPVNSHAWWGLFAGRERFDGART